MTVIQQIDLVNILRIVIPVLSLLLIVVGLILRKKNKGFITISIIGLIMAISFVVFMLAHDCKDFNVPMEGVNVDSDGNIYSNGECMICHKTLSFKNGEIIEE